MLDEHAELLDVEVRGLDGWGHGICFAAVGLMVKQALTKAGLPVHLIAQVVDEPSLAPQQQPKERIDRSDEPNLVPVLRTGRPNPPHIPLIVSGSDSKRTS